MRGQPPGTSLAWVLYVSVLLIATCGLVYELCAGALATYLLGNSVTQFSLVIGTYLSAMGVGSYLSRYLERDLLARFVEIEIIVALIGGSINILGQWLIENVPILAQLEELTTSKSLQTEILKQGAK